MNMVIQMETPESMTALDRLPHRYPALMLDTVVHLCNERVVAVKHVAAQDPHLQGHFPGDPIMPGVMILEAMAQAAGLLLARGSAAGEDNAARSQPGQETGSASDVIQSQPTCVPSPAPKPPLHGLRLLGADKVRWRHPVLPGDQMVIAINLLSRRGNVVRVKGEVKVGERLVAEGIILAGAFTEK